MVVSVRADAYGDRRAVDLSARGGDDRGREREGRCVESTFNALSVCGP